MSDLRTWPLVALSVTLAAGLVAAVPAWAEEESDVDFEEIGSVTVDDGRDLGVYVGRTVEDGLEVETVVLILPSFDETADNIVSVLMPEESDAIALMGSFASLDMIMNDLEARLRPIKYTVEIAPDDDTGLLVIAEVTPDGGGSATLILANGHSDEYSVSMDADTFDSFVVLLDDAYSSINPPTDEEATDPG